MNNEVEQRQWIEEVLPLVEQAGLRRPFTPAESQPAFLGKRLHVIGAKPLPLGDTPRAAAQRPIVIGFAYEPALLERYAVALHTISPSCLVELRSSIPNLSKAG